MKETGMLFSTDMVVKIPTGEKDHTRRLIKHINMLGDPENWCPRRNDPDFIAIAGDWRKYSPYAVGDRIYVRETWGEIEQIDRIWCHKEIVYKADYKKCYFVKWHPSLRMPKKYARLWLEITSVNVQQVKDITEEEAVEEGFRLENSICARSHRENSVCSRFHFLTYMENKYGMDVLDKWCWVIGFKVVKK